MNSDEILEFKAIITYQRYYNDVNTWGVYSFITDEDIPFFNTVSKTDSTFDTSFSNTTKSSVLAGKVQELTVGGEYLIRAKYKLDKTYGHQYTPVAVYALVPQTKELQLMFLQSVIPTNLAENLINAYPNIVNDVANGTITTIDFTKVNGIREITWQRIKDKIIKNYLISDIIVMLQPLGITYTMIKKLLENEPNPSLLKQKLNENPYILTVIPGLGFKRVDELALKLKPELLYSVERLVAYIKFFLTDMGESEGHTWCSIDILKESVENIVPECADRFEWLLGHNKFLHIDENRVGLQHYYDVEQRIIDIVYTKSQQAPSVHLTEQQINQAIERAESQQGFKYVNEQIEVIKKSLNRPVSLITGKAGCGKSTIMRAIIGAYTDNNYTVSASALSAMAAQRITEATNYHATTIHRALGCQGFNKFFYNKDNPMISKVVYMDEGSMTNATLFLYWLEAISDDAHIIISGDNKQLPPIGYGNVFSDLIEVLDKNVVSELTKPMRQAEMSGILVDANLIRDNKNPITEQPQPRLIHGELKDIYYMFRNNRQSLFDIAVKTFLQTIKTEGLDNVAIIVPRKKDCLNSTQELNKIIQDKLLCNESQEICIGDNKFKLGAKVMQTVNDYDKNVFNGEIGYITHIGIHDNGKKQEEYCVVTFKDGIEKEKKITYGKKDLVVLDLAYAITVHKAQGSGKQTVIGIIDNTHYQLLDNCMLYTLMTRAKKRCLLLAEPDAFFHCLRTSHNQRNTWLKYQAIKNA